MAAPVKYVTESEITYLEAFYMTDRFVYLNMWPDGIWYVDKNHSKIQEIKEAAILVAKTVGDKDAIEKINREIPSE